MSVDPWRPIGIVREEERAVGGVVPTLTVFLAGSECPFTCVFCDLWRFTTESATPEGAIPAQIERALAEAGEQLPEEARLKLYNASNFFDRRAVPAGDLPRIATLVRGFERVVVECHPRLIGDPVFEFAAALDGRLELAMGLETVHPEVLPRLNKRMTIEDYDQATQALGDCTIPHRAFVLVGAPFLEGRERVDWAVVSAAYAIERGAETVTLIPVRAGNGEMDRLVSSGDFVEPDLSEIERTLERSLALPGTAVVQADLWDLERFSVCEECLSARRERLERMNLSGLAEEVVECPLCESHMARRGNWR